MKILQLIKHIFIKKKGGRRFENYIYRFFKDSTEFDILEKHPFIEGMKSRDDNNPDFKFKDKRSGKVFLVECKWRPQWNKENGEEKTFLKRDKIIHYKQIQRITKYKLFIALGIGKKTKKGEEIHPNELYFFPIDLLNEKYPYIRKAYLIENKKQHDFKYKHPKFFPDDNNLK